MQCRPPWSPKPGTSDSMLASMMAGGEFRSGIPQKPRHGLQNFARKLLVRYCPSHADGADKGAICHDCPRSRGALVLPGRLTNQVCEQLDTFLCLPGDEGLNSLAAASDVSRQGADRTTGAGVIAMCFAQVIVNERLVCDGRSAQGCRIPLALPRSERRAHRF